MQPPNIYFSVLYFLDYLWYFSDCNGVLVTLFFLQHCTGQAGAQVWTQAGMQTGGGGGGGGGWTWWWTMVCT